MPKLPLIRSIDAIAVPVPDLDTGLAFYAGALGHPLRWRNDEIRQAALSMPGTDAEIVLTTRRPDQGSLRHRRRGPGHRRSRPAERGILT